MSEGMRLFPSTHPAIMDYLEVVTGGWASVPDP